MTFPHPQGNGRTSYWLDTVPPVDEHPPLAEDASADVVVVGAGIVGMTTAYLLAKAGKQVVVDRERWATAETGHTTAHLQIVIDTHLSTLVPRFGLDGARLTWESQLEAVRTIEQIAAEERIACELERVDAFLYGPRDDDVDLLRKEAELAVQMGFAAELVDPGIVPFEAKAVLRYPDQGKFHVRKYLKGVLRAAERMGVRFFAGTEVAKVVEGGRVRAKTRDGHTIAGDWLVHATNTPFNANETLHTKLFPYRTYAVGLRVPKGTLANALYWDTPWPYHYTRVEAQGSHDLVIHGGEDRKVGTDDEPDARFDDLVAHFRQVTDDVEVVYRWSGETLETADDLPYIGRVPGRPENELLATGDSGTGMTNGTIAAVMLSERILGRGTPYDELYDPARVTIEKRSIGDWIAENAQVTKDLVGGFVRSKRASTLPDLRPGEGAIVRSGLKQFAVARLRDGTLRCVDARCTHMGCTVAWNRSEASWDCPCHGSRFSPSGEILHGPANDPLAPADDNDLEKLGLQDAQRDLRMT